MVDFQIEKTLEALEPLNWTWKWMYHLYFPIDPKLRAASIWDKITDEQALADIERYWNMIQDMNLLWQFSLEWYSNIGSKDDLGVEMIITAIENGFTYINLPDTKGSEDPDNPNKEYYVETIRRHKRKIEDRFPGRNIVWSIHNHNDLWLAVQNSINGVKKWTWISKIEGTINGVWERSGNADLIQIIMRMKTTLSSLYNIDHIDATHLQSISDMVSELMLPVQPNYPIVWSNAMRHTSWWHTNAMLKDPTVYQPFPPELTGWRINLVYWPNSWGNLAISILEKNWYNCPKEDKQELDQYLKSRMQETWRYKWITDMELIELYEEFRSPIKIKWYEKKRVIDSNQVQIDFDGELFWENNIRVIAETAFSWLKDFVSQKIPGYSVKDFTSKSNEEWSRSEAISTVEIICEKTQTVTVWIGKDKDIETSWLKALANAFNQIFINMNYKYNTWEEN